MSSILSVKDDDLVTSENTELWYRNIFIVTQPLMGLRILRSRVRIVHVFFFFFFFFFLLLLLFFFVVFFFVFFFFFFFCWFFFSQI